jgi:hypothetical protein
MCAICFLFSAKIFKQQKGISNINQMLPTTDKKRIHNPRQESANYESNIFGVFLQY